MKNYEPNFANRVSTAAKAKQAMLKKASAIDPSKAPGFAERQAVRHALSIEREAQRAERKAARLAEKIRRAEEKAAEEVRKAEALVAEEERRVIELEATQKAARDARYAARKARKR